MLGALMLAGCGAEQVTLPADPPALLKPLRYDFGDSVHGRDVHAWVAAFDVLEPRFGKLRLGNRVLPATVPPESMRAELAARLEAQGWVPVADLGRGGRTNDSYAFGWSKAGKVYAVVGLNHRSAGLPTSPANIVTNIGDPGEPL